MISRKNNRLFDFFLPDDIHERYLMNEIYRARAIIGIIYISLFCCILLLLGTIELGGSNVIRICFFLNILYSICLLFYLKLSRENVLRRLRIFVIGYSFVLSSMVLYTIYAQVGLGFFAVIWFFPILAIASFIYNFRINIYLFLYICGGLIVTSAATYGNFFDLVVTNPKFKQMFIFYFFIAFFATYAFLYLRFLLNEILQDDIINSTEIDFNKSKYLALINTNTILAHEINNPLFAIQGKFHAVKNLYLEKKITEEKIDGLLGDVETIIERLSAQVKEVSSFAKEGMNSQMNLIQVEELIKEVLTLKEEKIQKEHVLIELYVEKGLSLICYPSFVRQVLLVLLSFLIKALEREEFKTIQIKACQKASWIYFDITSNGPALLNENDDVIENVVEKLDDIKNKNIFMIIEGLVTVHDGIFTYVRCDNLNQYRLKFPSYDEE